MKPVELHESWKNLSPGERILENMRTRIARGQSAAVDAWFSAITVELDLLAQEQRKINARLVRLRNYELTVWILAVILLIIRFGIDVWKWLV